MTMGTAGLWTCFLLACSLQLSSGFAGTGPLFLTPLIEAGEIDEAKSRSEVHFFKNYDINASAYSGYITVDERKGNNLFFLFIEAENNPSEAPLMLWTPGGPGLSALFALLLQNGPLRFDAPAILSRRELTIQKHMSVIYLDAPVGAGFSFSNTSAYPTILDEVTKDITAFLKQFLKLFKNYQRRDFYAAGDSYAARYSVALAEEMLRCPTEELPLKLQGIIGGVGFLAPIGDLADSSNFLYQTSMLNAEGYVEFKKQFAAIKYYTTIERNDTVALYLLFSTIFTSETKTLFQKLTLYNSHANPLYTERPQSMINCVGFVNESFFKEFLHAGVNATIQYANPDLLNRFSLDWLADITGSIQYVLNNTRVLFYSGQLDALFPSANLQAYFERLNWTYASEYREARRVLWQPYEGYYGGAGYTKSAGNFTSAVVLGMGHYAGFDKPEEIYHLIMQFINRNISFSSYEL